MVDVNSIEVTAKDFQKAMKTIVPASQRSVVSPARALSPLIWPLLKKALTQAVEILEKIFPPAHTKTGLVPNNVRMTVACCIYTV